MGSGRFERPDGGDDHGEFHVLGIGKMGAVPNYS